METAALLIHAVSVDDMTDVQAGSCSIHAEYIPSPWENDWLTRLAPRVSGDTTVERWRGCRELRSTQSLARIDFWLDLARSRGKGHLCAAWDRYSTACARRFQPLAKLLVPGRWNRHLVTSAAVAEGAALQRNWTALYEETMSHHVYRSCNGTVLARVPIEPLVSFLRHPRAICEPQLATPPNRSAFNWETILSKDHLIPLWASEGLQHIHASAASATSASASLLGTAGSTTAIPRRNLLFDLGASTWRLGSGGSSLSWLVDTYWRRGFARFERIFAWEAEPHTGAEILDARMPAPVLDALSYFNVPVDATPGARHNPLRTLEAVARPGDFVVWKMDFDNPAGARRAQCVRECSAYAYNAPMR